MEIQSHSQSLSRRAAKIDPSLSSTVKPVTSTYGVSASHTAPAICSTRKHGLSVEGEDTFPPTDPGSAPATFVEAGAPRTIHEDLVFVLSSTVVSDQEEHTLGGTTSSVHEDLEMRILTERLKLLSSQRQLAALHCQNFTDILEASLSAQAGSRRQQHSRTPPLSHAHFVASASCSASSTQPLLRQAQAGSEGLPTDGKRSSSGLPASPARPGAGSLEDDEDYWSSPNFYRGKHRGPYPVPSFDGRVIPLGSRLPMDPYFIDPQRQRKKPPNRHARRSSRFQQENELNY